MMTLLRRLSWLGVLVVTIGTLILAAQPPGDGSTAEARAERIAAELRCPVCQGLSVADSDSPTARSIRGDIDRRIADGQSDTEVRQAYVDRYGEWILLRPRADGFALTVWVLPAAAVAGALVVIVAAFRRWRRRLAARATDADRALVEQALGRPLGRAP